MLKQLFSKKSTKWLAKKPMIMLMGLFIVLLLATVLNVFIPDIVPLVDEALLIAATLKVAHAIADKRTSSKQ